MEIKSNILEELRWLNITELAQRAGVTRPTVYRYFRGERVWPHNAEAIEKEKAKMEMERKQEPAAA